MRFLAKRFYLLCGAFKKLGTILQPLTDKYYVFNLQLNLKKNMKKKKHKINKKQEYLLLNAEKNNCLMFIYIEDDVVDDDADFLYYLSGFKYLFCVIHIVLDFLV